MNCDEKRVVLVKKAIGEKKGKAVLKIPKKAR